MQFPSIFTFSIILATAIKTETVYIVLSRNEAESPRGDPFLILKPFHDFVSYTGPQLHYFHPQNPICPLLVSRISLKVLNQSQEFGFQQMAPLNLQDTVSRDEARNIRDLVQK